MKGRPRAVLYTRRDCPLCYALARSARRSSRRHGVGLVEVEVDIDPVLTKRYGERVPVLELPGGGSISGRISAQEVDRVFGEAASFLRAFEAPDPADGRFPPRLLARLLRVFRLRGDRPGDRTV